MPPLDISNTAAQGAMVGQLSGLMGDQSAKLLQTAIESAAGKTSGIIATTFGLVMLLVTASGVFGEMQSALNAIWKTPPLAGTVTRLVKARAASLGLVAALGFLLLVSLVISALLTALGSTIDAHFRFSDAKKAANSCGEPVLGWMPSCANVA